jgi:hypothetical protein
MIHHLTFGLLIISAFCFKTQAAIAFSCNDFKHEASLILGEANDVVMRSGSLSDSEMCLMFREQDIPKIKGHIEALEKFTRCPAVAAQAEEMLRNERDFLSSNEALASEYCKKMGL